MLICSRIRCVTFATAVGIGILAAGLAGAQGQSTEAPDLRDVQGLPYETVATDAVGRPPVRHDDMVNVVQAFENYRLSIQRLRDYREPLRTRGASGTDVFNQASPAIVLITTSEASGTGAIMDGSGLVLTNWHVIEGHSDAMIYLKPSQGVDLYLADAYSADVIAQDPVTDLALLQINDSPSGLPVLALGPAGFPAIAQDVHVIGHPLGYVWSYTTGVVSQVRENFSWDWGDGYEHTATVLQLQTTINPGNSGGPVLDDDGQILGLISMSDGATQIHFAIAQTTISAFFSRTRSTRALRLRGAGVREPDDERVTEVARAAYGQRQVIRASYSDLTTYTVLEADGSDVGLLVDDPAREGFVRAWQPAATGGYHFWALVSDDGETLAVGTGERGTPTRFRQP